MRTEPTALIQCFHAHVYFDAGTVEQAGALCLLSSQRFDLQTGRMHQQPVGPHPNWSCQLAFGRQAFGSVVQWLAMHRAGLVVFIHPLTGDEIADHRDHALWTGAVRPLDLARLVAPP